MNSINGRAYLLIRLLETINNNNKIITVEIRKMEEYDSLDNSKVFSNPPAIT